MPTPVLVAKAQNGGGGRGSSTYTMARRGPLPLGLAPDGGGGADAGGRAAGLLVVELQVLQPLGECQLLLYGHAEQRVQGLLLVLGRRQLPLHVVQLGHVLVTPEMDKEGWRGWGGRGGVVTEGRVMVVTVEQWSAGGCSAVVRDVDRGIEENVFT